MVDRRITRALLTLAVFCGHAGFLHAECLSLIKGAVILDVDSCAEINPESKFDLNDPEFKWIRDLDPAGRKQLYDSYRGLVLHGKIVQSKAQRSGLNDLAKGALSGATVSVYVRPGQSQCLALQGKRIAGALTEACCNGHGDPPCLLGTTYFLSSPAVAGDSATGAGDAVRRRAAASPEYAAGSKAYRQSKWKEAIKSFEQAEGKGDLDTKGLYMLGKSYHETDNCRAGVRPLRKLYDQHLQGKIWADELPIVRQSNFLLARCYAKNNDPQATVLILNGYLLEAKKYKKELKDALRNKDFGWIHTSKEYRDFKAAAEKQLRAGR